MIEQVELAMPGRSRVTLKKTGHGVLYLELSRPGNMKDGHGQIVIDGLFLEHEQVDKLCNLLRSHQTHATTHGYGQAATSVPISPQDTLEAS